MEEIKKFLIKYRGAIIGGLVAILALILNLHKIMIWVLIVIAGILIGNYIQHNKEMVKEKLGRPTIDFDNGRVDYCDQSFDDMHIFSFEFLDDEFKELQYFSIDG